MDSVVLERHKKSVYVYVAADIRTVRLWGGLSGSKTRTIHYCNSYGSPQALVAGADYHTDTFFSSVS